MNWFNAFQEIFVNKSIRKKVILTIILLIVFRILAQIPINVIDKSQLSNLFDNNQLIGLLDIFSGGALSSFSIGMMGVGPYITSSIILQLLTYVIPTLESLQKEGQQGQMIINQYTRLLTVPLGFIQGFGLLSILKSQGMILSITSVQLASLLLITTTTTVLLMWIGELITEHGVGNGTSLIITVGILSGIPVQIYNTALSAIGGGIIDSAKILQSILFIGLALVTVLFIVYVNDSSRKIPISYARRIVGKKNLGSVGSYLPIKINAAGVIPIIFALSVMVFPGLISKFVATNASSRTLASIFDGIANFFNPSKISYGISYFILVLLFTYFYTSIIFKPKDIAENLQKQGGFIPGIRPGNETRNYLNYVINRLTLPGSLFLGIIAILPFILQIIFKNSNFILGGTGILIVISVVLETANQVRSLIITSNYENYGV